MAIVRDQNNSYFLHRRDIAQDTSLSWEARGVMAYLLSMPDDAQVTTKDLEQQCGRNRVYRILKELRDANYLESSGASGKDCN